MILDLFIVLMALCVILVILGFWIDIKVLSLIGVFGMFLLSLLLQGGTITYENGINITTVGLTDVVTYNMEYINDSTSIWIGRYLAFASAVGFILVIISNRSGATK